MGHKLEARYTLSTALVGLAACGSTWEDASAHTKLLSPALAEYRRALNATSAPGIVCDALRDVKLIQSAGIEGLEPIFELLEAARHKSQ